MYIKNIGLFFHGRNPHPTVPSVKIVNALTSYTSNYDFQSQFSLKKENGKFY